MPPLQTAAHFRIIPKQRHSSREETPYVTRFDLDGTLTDSGPGIINCAQLALAHFGIQVPDRDQLRVFVGPPLRQSFARFGVPPASLDEAIARFRARYVPIGKFENTPYPGIAGLLDRLQGAGYRLFVATSKPQVTAQEVLEHFQLARYFERVCGASLDLSLIHISAPTRPS